jgi:hypothetical protein
MNTEILRLQNGSKLYGLDHAGSDDDLLALFVEPPENVFSYGQTKTYNLHDRIPGEKTVAGDIDGIAFSVRHFLTLASLGNPSLLATLYAPSPAIISGNDCGLTILHSRDLFVSKLAAPRFLGYMAAQLQRLTGKKAGHIPNRPEIVAEFGYDTKYASQVARLALQGIEFLADGKMTLPMLESDVKLCKDIRFGQYSFDDCIDILDTLEEVLKQTIAKSTLPDEPDYAKIWHMSRVIHEETWSLT